MRCHICDKAMSEKEIQVSPDGVTYEPCATCMDVIIDAAYSDGFTKEDPLDDPELQEAFGDGAVETLDIETYRSVFDHCDATVEIEDDTFYY